MGRLWVTPRCMHSIILHRAKRISSSRTHANNIDIPPNSGIVEVWQTEGQTRHPPMNQQEKKTPQRGPSLVYTPGHLHSAKRRSNQFLSLTLAHNNPNFHRIQHTKKSQLAKKMKSSAGCLKLRGRPKRMPADAVVPTAALSRKCSATWRRYFPFPVVVESSRCAAAAFALLGGVLRLRSLLVARILE